MSKKSPARHRESAPAPSWFDDARYEDVRFSATFEYNELSLNRAAEQIAPRLKGILTVADFGSLIVLILLAMALRDQTLLLVIVFLIPATLLYVTNNLSSLQVRYARGTNLDPVTMGSRVHVTVCENSLHLCNDEGGQQDAEKRVARLQDRARHARAVGQAHVEEDVLKDRLEDRECSHVWQVAALRHERPPPCHAHARDDHEARDHEARAREREDGRHVGGVNPKQIVADLHARERRPPQKARRQTRQHHPRRRGDEWPVLLFSNHVQLLRRRLCCVNNVSAAGRPDFLSRNLPRSAVPA